MGTWLKALAAGIGLPLLALTAISASLAFLDEQAFGASTAGGGAIPADVTQALRLQAYCADAGRAFAAGTLCTDVGLGSALEALALVATGISAALLFGVIPIAALGRRSRPFLGIVFRPVLVLILGALLVVMAIDGALVVGGVYLAESAYLGIIHPWLLGALAIAVVVAVMGVLSAIATMLAGEPVMVRGVRLGQETDRELVELVADVARQIGTDPPDQILAGLDPTFFAVEADVLSFGRRYTGRTLFVSVPLCRILSVDELRAVVAHELGHFKGDDTQYSKRFAPGYRGAVNSLATLHAASSHPSGIPLLAPMLVLTACLERFGTAEREIGRSRELAADAVAAAATSPEAIGTTLLKLSAHSSAWDEVMTATVRAVGDGRPVGNISKRYADWAQAGADIAAIARHENDTILHPFDSHPPVDTRLAALGVSADSLAGRAAVANPATPAVSLIGEVEALEVKLSDRLAAAIAGRVGRAAGEAAKDHSAALRAAAASNPVLSRVIRLFEPLRGPDLGRPLIADGPWMALADLEIAPHPDPRRFRSIFPADVLPVGKQRLVIGLAGPDVPEDRRIDAGTMLWLAGLGTDVRRRAGKGETYYIDGGNGFAATQLLVVREVGDAPLAHQVAGLFVVPASDPLAFGRGQLGEELSHIVRELSSTSPGQGLPAGQRSNGVADVIAG